MVVLPITLRSPVNPARRGRTFGTVHRGRLLALSHPRGRHRGCDFAYPDVTAATPRGKRGARTDSFDAHHSVAAAFGWFGSSNATLIARLPHLGQRNSLEKIVEWHCLAARPHQRLHV